MVHISFHVFHKIGLKTVFDDETCRVIQYTEYNSWVDDISCFLKTQFSGL
jgi:hypothetical protein